MTHLGSIEEKGRECHNFHGTPSCFLPFFTVISILQSHVVKNEAVDVGLLFKSFRQGLASTMTGFGVDANERGR